MAEENEDSTQEKKGLLDVKLIIVAIAIIILASGIAFVVAKMFVEPLGQEDDEQNIAARSIGPVHELDELIVNLADSGGRRFIMTKITFEVEKNSVSREMTEKNPVIIDRVIMILGDKTITDIETSAGKDNLKQELIDNINPLLASGEIIEVYFETFTFQ